MAIAVLILATVFGTAHSIALIGLLKVIDHNTSQNKRAVICIFAVSVIGISGGLQREIYIRFLEGKTRPPDELSFLLIIEGAINLVIILRKLQSIGTLRFGHRKE